MDSFLRFYKLYYAINVWSIVKPVYFGSFLFSLWASLAAFTTLNGVAIYLKIQHWAIVPIGILAWIWFSQHSKAIDRHYQRHYSLNKDRLGFYGKGYQYLRYCVFRDQLIKAELLGNLDDVIAHLEIELETETSTAVSSHPFFASGITLLSGIVGGLVGAWKIDITVQIVVWLFAILSTGYIILSASKTPSVRLKEFKRFLYWLKAESTNLL